MQLNYEPQIQLADRLHGLGLSEIVRISEHAQKLRASGRDVIALSTGEPDTPTPIDVVEAAHQAALDGQTRYTATAGMLTLRETIAARSHAGAENVIVSTGAKQVIANAFLATLSPGDEVIIPAPFWSSYPDIVRLAGGNPKSVSCPMNQGFKINAEQLDDAITPRTRWLMLNSPSNPTGAVYSKQEYSELGEVLQHYPQVAVLTDEIYEHLTFNQFTSFLSANPFLRTRTLVVNGVSKAWSMTGWRIGWGVGPKSLISAMISVQGQITSGASSVSQAAALAALKLESSELDERLEVFRLRRDKVVAALNAIDGINCPTPDGAFYAFPSCATAIEADGCEHKKDTEFCAWLLESANVAVVPGSAFGMPGHFRLSFAYSDHELQKGLSRIAKALGKLRQ